MDKKKISLIKNFFAVKFFKQRMPLFIGWDLTNKCNFNCKYCKVPDLDAGGELNTGEVSSIIKNLKKLRTARIHFGGGEVLLREDLGKVLACCGEEGIFAAIITNAFLFKQRLEDIKKASLVKISFDGPKKIHDYLRQEGSFDRVIEAVELAKKNRINIAFNTTLSAGNFEEIEYILKTVSDLKVPVKFQLVNEFLAGDRDISEIQLNSLQTRQIMNKLIRAKKNNKYIINSVRALSYMRDYPLTEKIPCAAAKIYARISAHGYIFACAMKRQYKSETFIKEHGLAKAFSNLSCKPCDHCLCTSTLELNFIYALDVGALINSLKKF